MGFKPMTHYLALGNSDSAFIRRKKFTIIAGILFLMGFKPMTDCLALGE